MKLSTVLAALPQTTKTASASPVAGTPAEKTAADASDKLRDALRQATAPAAPVAEKTAAAAPTSPVGDLVKTAERIATAEHEALTKEAQMYGAAVCDGFMARMSQYNEAAEKVAASMPKTAAAQAPVAPAASDVSFDKFAAENADLVKQAAEVGYERTMGQLEKLAAAAYEKGYNETVEHVYKCAHAAFCAGFDDALKLVEELRK